MSVCDPNVRDLLTLAPFADNGSFLAAKLREFLLRADYCSWQRALAAAEQSRPPSAPVCAPSLSPATIELRRQVELRERRFLLSRAWNTSRLAVSAHTDIPFLDLVAEYELGSVEQDALWMLFFWTTSRVFRQAHAGVGDRRSDDEPSALTSVGALLLLLSPDPALQIGLLRYFGPDVPLRRHGLILVGARSEAGTTVMQQRLRLSDAITFRMAGGCEALAAGR